MRVLCLLLLASPAWATQVESACSFEPWNCSSPVPEPETLGLLAIAAVAAFLTRRRK